MSSVPNMMNDQCPSSAARTLNALIFVPSSDTTAGRPPSLSTRAQAATEKLRSVSTVCGALTHCWPAPSRRAARSDESGIPDWPAVYTPPLTMVAFRPLDDESAVLPSSFHSPLATASPPTTPRISSSVSTRL